MKHDIKIGRQIVELESIDSTNNYLSKLINTTIVPNGTVILAHEQTKGKGQRGNSWQSNKNENLTFSIYINTLPLKPNQIFYISMAVANAIHKTLIGITPNIKIKWPNDLLIKSKKAGGILIENSISSNAINNIIIGIGLNINQKEFDNNLKATSLFNETREFTPKMEVLHTFIYQFQKEMDLLISKNFITIKQYYLNHLFGFKNSFNYSETDSELKMKGIIKDVEPNGTICIETNEGNKRYQFKEIVFL